VPGYPALLADAALLDARVRKAFDVLWFADGKTASKIIHSASLFVLQSWRVSSVWRCMLPARQLEGFCRDRRDDTLVDRASWPLRRVACLMMQIAISVKILTLAFCSSFCCLSAAQCRDAAREGLSSGARALVIHQNMRCSSWWHRRCLVGVRALVHPAEMGPSPTEAARAIAGRRQCCNRQVAWCATTCISVGRSADCRGGDASAGEAPWHYNDLNLARCLQDYFAGCRGRCDLCKVHAKPETARTNSISTTRAV